MFYVLIIVIAIIVIAIVSRRSNNAEIKMDSMNNEISTTSQIQSETENKERISAQMDVQTTDSGKTVNTTAPSAESSGNSLTEKYSNLTPHQQENERIKEGILDNMTLGTNYTIADMLCTFDCFPENMTPTRLSALLSQLGPRGSQQIDRIEANGKAYFCLVKQSDSTDASDDERKLTPHQIENDAIMTGIVDNMAVGTNYTIVDMLCTFDCFPETMTPQRLSALLSQLGERGSQQIDRIEADGKAFFVLNENGVQKKATITQEYKAKIKEAESKQSVYSTGAYGSGALYSPAYSSFSNGTQKTRRKTEYYTDWDGRKYYYDKNGVKKYKQERVYHTDWDGRQYYFNKNGEKKYRQERKKTMDSDYYDDPLKDPRHYNNYQNGPTDHGTFIGNCKMCGTTWEFPSSRVIPVPYPHATCPNCRQWVAVF